MCAHSSSRGWSLGSVLHITTKLCFRLLKRRKRRVRPPSFPCVASWSDGKPFTLTPYEVKFRKHQKNFHRAFGGRAAVSVYYPIEEGTLKFLQCILANLDDLNVCLRAYVKFDMPCFHFVLHVAMGLRGVLFCVFLMGITSRKVAILSWTSPRRP